MRQKAGKGAIRLSVIKQNQSLKSRSTRLAGAEWIARFAARQWQLSRVIMRVRTTVPGSIDTDVAGITDSPVVQLTMMALMLGARTEWVHECHCNLVPLDIGQ